MQKYLLLLIIALLTIDATAQAQTSEHQLTPKLSFELHSFEMAKEDTLVLITCSDFVYFPFGKINSKNELKNSLLKDFNIVNTVDSLHDDVFELQIIKFNSSNLVLFFDNAPEVISSYIIRGVINDEEFRFVNRVAIDMTKTDFFNEFFDSFPNELLNKYNVIIFESCVTGIVHIYTFQGHRLESIKYRCVDCIW